METREAFTTVDSMIKQSFKEWENRGVKVKNISTKLVDIEGTIKGVEVTASFDGAWFVVSTYW